LLNKYPLASYPNPSLAEIAMAQGQKSCTARFMEQSWSKYVPVYAYEFQERTAPSYFQPVSYPMRAFHTAELQYLFPLFHGGQGTPHALNAEQERLSDTLVDYWTTFAKYGAPNAPAKTELPDWPRYLADKDNIQAIDLPGQKQVGGYGKMYDCEFWDPIIACRFGRRNSGPAGPGTQGGQHDPVTLRRHRCRFAPGRIARIADRRRRHFRLEHGGCTATARAKRGHGRSFDHSASVSRYNERWLYRAPPLRRCGAEHETAARCSARA
jgi:hypothetical protein